MKKVILISALIVLVLIVIQLITGPGIIATSKVGGQYIVLKQVLTYIALTFIIIGLFVSLYCYFYNQSRTKLAFLLPVVGSALLIISNPYTMGHYNYSLLVVSIPSIYLLFKRKS